MGTAIATFTVFVVVAVVGTVAVFAAILTVAAAGLLIALYNRFRPADRARLRLGPDIWRTGDNAPGIWKKIYGAAGCSFGLALIVASLFARAGDFILVLAITFVVVFAIGLSLFFTQHRTIR